MISDNVSEQPLDQETHVVFLLLALRPQLKLLSLAAG